MTDGAVQVPRFIAGTWQIDRGRFNAFSGTIVASEDLARSSVRVLIEAASINTSEPNRDNHVRTADLLMGR